MAINLVIVSLALTVIMTSVIQIEMAPTQPSNSKDYYLTRAWGESSVPFTVIYSNHARTQQKKASITTTRRPPIPSTPQKRRQNTTTTTKRPSQLSNLFVSNGWGPIG